MSVIDTKMNIPKGCWSCSNLRALDPETDVCRLTEERFEDRLSLSHNRHDKCPLKTVEGLIKRIENLDHVWVFDEGLTATDKRDIVINAIKEYCEVKE